MLRTFGVDIARQGEDKSVLVVLDIENKVYTVQEIAVWAKADTMESVGRIERLYRKWKPDKIIIDADGIGAGCFDRLRELEYPVFAFHSSARCDLKDMTGEQGFLNMRSYAWWNLRELMDPASGFTFRLPKNDDLVGDLCAPKWFIRSGSLIQIESKDKIKIRLGRSPDLADSLCYSAADVDRSQFAQAYAVHQGSTVEKEILPEIRPKQSESAMLEALLWMGSKRNHDVFDW